MRYDSQGLHWQDEPRVSSKKAGNKLRSKPPIPPGFEWCPPALPNLTNASKLVIDCETYDPYLKEKGPSVRRGGYIVGIAVATEDASWYIPLEHEQQYDPNGCNLDRDTVFRWARDNLCGPQPKLFTNGLYDLDYLWEAGVQVPGPYHDIQIAEPLLDENSRDYSLDALAYNYLGEGKRGEALYQWLSIACGGAPTAQAQGKNIHLAPPELVAHYALGDVELPREIFKRQWSKLKHEELTEVYDIERRLIPLLLAMRRRGVAVDVSNASTLDERLVTKALEYREELTEQGIEDPWSPELLALWCDRNDIKYKKTPKGAPSFRGPWLENHQHDVLQLVHQVRRLEKHAGTFIQGTVLSNEINGRIHCQFHQLKGDEYGTVSGRFSSSHPNLQNIPSRDDELGPLIRGLFIPELGEEWRSDDWSQIEFRLLVHYGRGPTAAATREKYRTDASTDFHKYVAEMTGIPRKPAKNVNFGLVYGMGEPTMAANLGRSLEEVRPMFEQYHREMPFIKEIYDEVGRMAGRRGWIKTILGRKRRWDLWQSRVWKTAKKDGAFSYDDAIEKYGSEARIQRAYTHKALNSLLQGGAADIMKKAMVDIWEAGICEVLGAPLSTVHDELNWSVPPTKEADQAHKESVRLMEACCADRLRLPLRADSTRGRNWGEAK